MVSSRLVPEIQEPQLHIGMVVFQESPNTLWQFEKTIVWFVMISFGTIHWYLRFVQQKYLEGGFHLFHFCHQIFDLTKLTCSWLHHVIVLNHFSWVHNWSDNEQDCLQYLKLDYLRHPAILTEVTVTFFLRNRLLLNLISSNCLQSCIVMLLGVKDVVFVPIPRHLFLLSFLKRLPDNNKPQDFVWFDVLPTSPFVSPYQKTVLQSEVRHSSMPPFQSRLR